MQWNLAVEAVAAVAGAALLIRGYRRNHRQLLVAGALVLFASVTVPDFAKGMYDGMTEGYTASSAHSL